MKSDHARQTTGLVWLMVAHFTNDIYANYLPALLPLLAEIHGFGLGQAGLLVSIATLSGSLLQPGFGYLADNARLRVLAPVGLAGAALGSALLGVAPSYLWLAAATVVHGLGMAAFHPPSAGLVHELSGPRKGARMATYIMAGQIGQALSPLCAALVAVHAGMPWVAATAVPALVVAAVLARVTPWEHHAAPRARPPRLGATLRQNLSGLVRLMGLILSRSIVVHALLALLPFLYRERGAPATVGAAAITAMVLSGAFGGVIAGHLSDRYGRRLTLFVSFALATPLFLAAVLSTGPVSIVFLILGGGALFGSSSLVTVEAQSLLPAHASVAAGLMMGVGLGIGGVLVGPISALAQAFGIIPVLTAVCLLPLPGSVLTLSLAGREAAGRDPSNLVSHQPLGEE